MMRNTLETKKYKVEYLGEFAYDDSFEYSFDRYLVEVKDIECSAIMYEFDQSGVCCMEAWEQNNQTKEGQELTNYTRIIGKLIENDIVDIVAFMDKHL